jgi:hypothetical protein
MSGALARLCREAHASHAMSRQDIDIYCHDIVFIGRTAAWRDALLINIDINKQQLNITKHPLGTGMHFASD